MNFNLLCDVDFGLVSAGQIEEDIFLEPHGIVLGPIS